MAEDASKIISLVFEDAGPDGGSDYGQRGAIRMVADFGPSPCMIGTAELPLYFSSYAASMAEAVSLPPGSNVTS